MATVGVNKLHYAILKKDDATGVEYETPVRIAGVINVNLSRTTNSNTLYADDSPYEAATSYGGTSISIEVADLPLEAQAALLGHELKDGVLIRKSTDQAPYVAILFESTLADGTTQYVKALKGVFRVPNEEYNTKTDSPEFKTLTIEADFISRKYDHRVDMTVRSSDSDAAKHIATWYTSVEETA